MTGIEYVKQILCAGTKTQVTSNEYLIPILVTICGVCDDKALRAHAHKTVNNLCKYSKNILCKIVNICNKVYSYQMCLVSKNSLLNVNNNIIKIFKITSFMLQEFLS